MCLLSIVNLRPNLVISKRTSSYNEKIFNYQVNLIIHLLHKYTLDISVGQILEIKRYQQESNSRANTQHSLHLEPQTFGRGCPIIL